MSITQLIDRTLTQKFGIIERVAPTYDSSYTIIYNANRIIKGGTTFYLATNSPNYDVVHPADELASKTYSVVDSYMVNPANLFDFNDNTYAYSNASVPAAGELTEVNCNFGSVYTGFLYFVYSNALSSYLAFRLYISSDGTTWTKIYDDNGSAYNAGTITVFQLVSSSLQYLSLRLGNRSTTTALSLGNNFELSSLEFYPANIRNALYFPNDTTDIVKVFSSNYSVLYEVVTI